jgi:hypothetical protein
VSGDNKWVWSHKLGKYIEVYPIGSDNLGRCYRPVDVRAVDQLGVRARTYANMNTHFDEKPEEPPTAAPNSTSLEVEFFREVTCSFTDTVTRGPTNHVPKLYECSDVEDLSVYKPTVKATVKSVSGYEDDKTHLCQWCESVSAANPLPNHVCPGCGAQSWEPWINKPVLTVGMVLS